MPKDPVSKPKLISTSIHSSVAVIKYFSHPIHYLNTIWWGIGNLIQTEKKAFAYDRGNNLLNNWWLETDKPIEMNNTMGEQLNSKMGIG